MAQVDTETLFFAERSQAGLINYWPEHDKRGQAAIDEGIRRADALVTAMRVSGHPIMLPFVMEALGKCEWGLLERTFCHRMGEHLLP